MARATVTQSCLTCGTSFTTLAFRIKHGRGKFCSRPCAQRNPNLSVRARFLKRIRKTDTCWLWTGHCNDFGYGILYPDRRAHRISWEIHNGAIPHGMSVLHRCDNPPCVNPDHLFLGTQEDNMKDMASKGRAAYGIKSATAKLSEDDVRAIRAAPKSVTNKELATVFPVSASSVQRIRAGIRWRHVAT